MNSYSVISLHVYPVKSMRGLGMKSVRVHQMGFRYDRRWMLIDRNNRFLTQREYPALATFTTALTETALTIAGPEGSAIDVPLAEDRTPTVRVAIWKNSVEAHTSAPDVDAYLSDRLGTGVRLVRIPEAAVRQVDQAYGRPEDHVSFADGYPILVTCTASLDDLNSRLRSPVPMNRFRPNLVLQTEDPFEEDSWTSLEGPGLRLRLVKPCDRCVIITTDQTTGHRSEEPLRTLASYRHKGHGAFFGMNCIPDADGTIAVNEHLTASP